MGLFRKKNKSKKKQYSSEIHKSLNQKVKGYESYDSPEERKKTDLAFREYLYEQVIEMVKYFAQIKDYLIRLQILSTWSAAESITKNLNRMKYLLTAKNDEVYRHSTFFDSPKISEWIEISVLYIIESEMILIADEILRQMKDMLEGFQKEEAMQIELKIMEIEKGVRELTSSLNERAELIASFEIMALE